jgi:hypothetical protein
MMVDTRNHSYQNKTKGNFKKNPFIPNSSVSNSQQSDSRNTSISMGHLAQTIQQSQVVPIFFFYHLP